MDLSHVIIGQVVTEKSERMKGENKTYVIQIAPGATKIDVKSALNTLYGVDVNKVRIVKTRAKTRTFGRGRTMEKRHPAIKAYVTLSPKSKALDLVAFQ